MARKFWILWRARRDSNPRPPGSKLEETEKLENPIIGSS